MQAIEIEKCSILVMLNANDKKCYFEIMNLIKQHEYIKCSCSNSSEDIDFQISIEGLWDFVQRIRSQKINIIFGFKKEEAA